MAGFSIWCRLWPLLVLLTTSQCAHIIRENGSKTTIACVYGNYELNTTWQVRAGHDFINVTSCTFGKNICVDRMPQQFHGEADDISDGFKSWLIINNVRINETEFRCLGRYGIHTNTLEVYARPSIPVCNPVELDYTRKNLQFRCRATKVFPFARAGLYTRSVTFSQEDILSHHCSEDYSSLTMDGYSAECVWRISAANLEPLTYKYYIKVFPHVSNTTGINVPYALSQDYTLQLSSPVAVIDYSHCPVGPGVVNGKIITGSTATCRCVLESPGFPPGQARWYTQNGNKSLGQDDATDGSSTLVIDTTISGQSYKCGAESPLNIRLKWGPVYTPVFTGATTPSSSPETYSVRIEQVAGIVAGSVLLTLIIGAVLWKWRSRKRQSADTTRVVYNKPIVDAGSDSDYLKVYEHYEKVF